MSLAQIGGKAMWRIFSLLIIYFVLGPAYYGILNAMYAQAVANGGTSLTTFIAWIYPMFYYGFPSLIVLGVIFVVLGFYRELRQKYYATEEIGYYGS